MIATPELSSTPAVLPVFKWAGGKRWLVPRLVDGIRAQLARTGGRYLEPFLGGGAIALALAAPRALLGDVEAPLVDTYRAIVADPDAVAAALAALVARGTDGATYYAVRAATPRAAAPRAARLLYLNHLGFNGLYRTNRSGQFNVPHGRYAAPSFPSVSDLYAVAHAFAGAALTTGDFGAIVAAAGPGDLLYADPPYHSVGGHGFRSYASHPFTEADQARLAGALRAAAARGATVVTTNADTPAVREWYAWATVTSTAERRNVNRRGGERGEVPCVLITTVDRERQQ